jgi:UDP-N-acetylglucosamine 2-epimerase (non-hydrolysing)
MVIYGTRPEAIKLAPVIKQFQETDGVRLIVVNTGQHDAPVNEIQRLFEFRPDIQLSRDDRSGSIGRWQSEVLGKLDRAMEQESPDIVVVQGDTTTAVSGALAGFYRRIPLAHVEAGLRTPSITEPFPEEANRRTISLLADIHFAPTRRAYDALIGEGVPASRVTVTGNTGIDAMRYVIDRIGATARRHEGVPAGRMVVVTLHRRENQARTLDEIATALRSIRDGYPDTYFMCVSHPNPELQQRWRDLVGAEARFTILAPLPYEEFIRLLIDAHLIITDSGGIQEEAPSIGKPVLIVRNETERPEVLENNAGVLAGVDADRIEACVRRLLDDAQTYESMAKVRDLYGDGRASERIVKDVMGYLRITHA